MEATSAQNERVAWVGGAKVSLLREGTRDLDRGSCMSSKHKPTWLGEVAAA